MSMMMWNDENDDERGIGPALDASEGDYGDVDDIGDDEPIAHTAPEPDALWNPPTAADRATYEAQRELQRVVDEMRSFARLYTIAYGTPAASFRALSMTAQEWTP